MERAFVNANPVQLSVGHLPAGLYLIEARQEDKAYTGRLEIQR